jgi:hypothetical protein
VPDTLKEIQFDDVILLLIEWSRRILQLEDIKGEIEC